MVDTKNPMTQKGYDDALAELRHMLEVDRPNVIQAIAEAREHGDLSENAEYKAAKEKQGHIESKIAYLDKLIQSARVIKEPEQLNTVQFGSRIRVLDVTNDEFRDFYIVGDYESNIKEGKISVFSPVARALIGKSKDDVVEVKTPNGVKEYEIMEIYVNAS